jgi:hypothetical protein
LADEYNFYTKNSTVNIKFEKMIANGNRIEAAVVLDDYRKIVPMDSENQITLQLPKEGKYDVFIGANADKPSLGMTIFFKLNGLLDSVSYSPSSVSYPFDVSIITVFVAPSHETPKSNTVTY